MLIQDELLESLKYLRDVSAPYLQRKKETPRHECNRLNDAHRHVNSVIEQAESIKAATMKANKAAGNTNG